MSAGILIGLVLKSALIIGDALCGASRGCASSGECGHTLALTCASTARYAGTSVDALLEAAVTLCGIRTGSFGNLNQSRSRVLRENPFTGCGAAVGTTGGGKISEVGIAEAGVGIAEAGVGNGLTSWPSGLRGGYDNGVRSHVGSGKDAAVHARNDGEGPRDPTWALDWDGRQLGLLTPCSAPGRRMAMNGRLPAHRPIHPASGSQSRAFSSRKMRKCARETSLHAGAENCVRIPSYQRPNRRDDDGSA